MLKFFEETRYEQVELFLESLHAISRDMNPGRRAPSPNTLASSIRIVLRIRFNDGLNDAIIGCDKPIDKSVNATKYSLFSSISPTKN